MNQIEPQKKKKYQLLSTHVLSIYFLYIYIGLPWWLSW